MIETYYDYPARVNFILRTAEYYFTLISWQKKQRYYWGYYTPQYSFFTESPPPNSRLLLSVATIPYPLSVIELPPSWPTLPEETEDV